MTQTRADTIAPHLWIRLALLSPGDLSVNRAVVERHDATLLTAPGSPNDALWSDMAELNWTREMTLDDPILASSGRAYAFTEAGIPVMKSALAELERQRATLLAKIKGYDARSMPGQISAICERLGFLSTKLLALLIVARGRTFDPEKDRVGKAEYVSALETIARGVETAARAVESAIVVGPESDDGQDWLRRTSAALDYADRLLGAPNPTS